MANTMEFVAADEQVSETHLEGAATLAGPFQLRSPILTMGHLGTHVVWSILNARAALFLQRLGLYKSVVALIMMAGPLSGLVVQPAVGVLSDQCTSTWGRRRPFILLGLAACATSLLSLAFASSLSRQDQSTQFQPFVALLGIVGIVGIDLSVNTLSAAHRALTMDVLGPDEQDIANAWSTRYSNLGSLLGYMLGVLDLPRIFAFTGLSDQLAILSLCAIVIVIGTHATLFTLLRESVLIDSHQQRRPCRRQTWWQMVKNIGLDLYRCGRSLPPSIWDLFVIQFFSWLAWFPVLYYAASWVAEIFSLAQGASSSAASSKEQLGEEARRTGSLALFYYALTGLVASIVLPWCVYDPLAAKRSSYTHIEPADQVDTELEDLRTDTDRVYHLEDVSSRGSSDPTSSWTSSSSSQKPISLLSPFRHWPWRKRGPTLAEIWFLAQVTFVITVLFFTCPVFSYKSVSGAVVLVSVLGVLWAVTLWVPYAILGILVFSEKPMPANIHSLRGVSQRNGEAVSVRSEHARDLRAETGAITGLHNWSIVLPQLLISLISSLCTLNKKWPCLLCHGCAQFVDANTCAWTRVFSSVSAAPHTLGRGVGGDVRQHGSVVTRGKSVHAVCSHVHISMDSDS